ncbi:MAG: exogenous ferric siderophore receptor [Chloroflexota bacterium]|nr:MAG: exogenous ferric siderophore receptor [Chloroflexota bacterium]
MRCDSFSMKPNLSPLSPRLLRPLRCAYCLALIGGTASASLAETDDVGANPNDPVVLEHYVVTAAGFSQAFVQAPASISVVSREELMEKRVHSIAEAIAETEGVDVGASAGKTGGLNVSIRGMPSDYTLILVDGRRQNTAGNVTPNGFGETATSFLPPPAAIERIEVIRGPMSTLYGSDAMGGVVNIITRKVGEVWTGSVTAGATIQEDSDFGNATSVNTYLSGPVIPRKLGLTLRGNLYRREASDLSYTNAAGAPVAVSKRGPSPVEADIHTLGLRADLVPHPQHNLWLDAEIYRQAYDNRSGQLGTLDTGVTFNGYSPVLRFNRDQLTLAHSGRFERGVLDSSLVRNVTETIGRTIPPGTPGKAPGSARALENDNLIFDTKAVLTFGDHTVSVGGQYWAAEMVDGVAPAPYEQTQWALFAEDEWRLRSDLRLTLGARRDEHSQFGHHVNPRAYLVWNATERWSFKAGVSQGFKAPRLDQIANGITGFTAQGTRPTIGTPSLRPETSTSAEAGVIFESGNGLRLSLTAFNNAFDDKIASGPGLLNATFAASPNRPGSVNYGNWPAVDTFAQLINVDRAVTRGLEAGAHYRFSRHWSVTGNYTYTDSEQRSGTEAGRPLYDTPRHMANARVRWTATAKLSVWLSGEYRSERHRNPDTATSRAKATYGDYRDYELFHVGGAYQVSPQFALNATVYNLLDQDFVAYGPYVSNTQTGAIAYTNLYSNNQEPRRLWLSGTYSF